jgi:hypothetical protein
MSEYKDPTPDLRANRRKEIFRAVRGTKLTGQRGRWSAGAPHQGSLDSRKALADDESPAMRRVRLGRVVEDESGAAEASDARRYSEPND